MAERTRRQLPILSGLAAVALAIGLALGASWTLNLWDARQQINKSEVASCKNEDSDCAKKDLPAQVRAATAAEAMADIAIWQTVLSGLGIGGLLYSLYLTREAVKASRDAAADTQESLRIAQINADHSARQVKISEDTAKHQLRAYVAVSETLIRPLSDGPQRYEVIIKIQNTGLTPAHDVEHFGSMWLGPKDQFPTTIIPRDARPKFAIHSQLRQSVNLIGSLGDEDAKRVQSGEFSVFVFGEFRYSDIFGDKHVTGYRSLVVPGQTHLAMCMEGNFST